MDILLDIVSYIEQAVSLFAQAVLMIGLIGVFCLPWGSGGIPGW